MATNINSIPLELLRMIFKYAIQPSSAEPEYLWKPLKTNLTTYTSLPLVNRHFNRAVNTLYAETGVVDITFFFDNVPDLYNMYLASQKIRILRDAKFRLTYSVYDMYSPQPSRQKDVQGFVACLAGFKPWWTVCPDLWNGTWFFELPLGLEHEGFSIIRYDNIRAPFLPMRAIQQLQFPALANNLTLTVCTYTELGMFWWLHAASRTGSVAVLEGGLKDIKPSIDRFEANDLAKGWFRVWMYNARMHLKEERASEDAWRQGEIDEFLSVD